MFQNYQKPLIENTIMLDFGIKIRSNRGIKSFCAMNCEYRYEKNIENVGQRPSIF